MTSYIWVFLGSRKGLLPDQYQAIILISAWVISEVLRSEDIW